MEWDFLDTLGYVIVYRFDITDLGDAEYYEVLDEDDDVIGRIFGPYVDFDDMTIDEVREYVEDNLE